MDSVKPNRKPFWKRWSVRIVAGLLAFLVVAYQFVGPEPPAPPRSSGEPMQAILYHDYGDPSVLKLETVARPLPDDDQVLVRVRAAGANPLDWHTVRGKPRIARLLVWGLREPVDPRVGADFAGEIVAVGARVTKFNVGDAVFGTGAGTFADYVRAREVRIVKKPANLTFEEAAGVPVAAVTALQGLRDAGRVRTGSKVLINGASGGVGTFAVQIAKSLGAEVTGVCSTRNVDLVRSLGADRVIDYTKTDFTAGNVQYDVIIDNVVNKSFGDLKRVMAPGGIHVRIGGSAGPEEDGTLGFVTGPLWGAILSKFGERQFVTMFAEVRESDLEYLRALLESGKIRTVVDRTFALPETPEAIRYLETGRARGKVIVRVDHPAN